MFLSLSSLSMLLCTTRTSPLYLYLSPSVCGGLVSPFFECYLFGMASQSMGIQQLLAAEKKSAEKVAEARKRMCYDVSFCWSYDCLMWKYYRCTL